MASSKAFPKAARSCSWGLLRSVACFVSTIALCCADAQQEQAGASCSARNPGPPQRLSTLDTQQLASGVLNGTATALWDFEGRQEILTASAGTRVSMACFSAVNVTLSAPEARTVFLQPTAINVSAATGLTMDSVSLSTDCQTVWRYQSYLCESYRAAGSLLTDVGVIHFMSWRDNFTSLRNVTLTCPSTGAAPKPPCWMVAVQTARELLDAFTVYAAFVAASTASATANVTVVVASNVTIPRSLWQTTVPVSANITLAGSSLLDRPIVDMGLMIGLWDLMPGASVLLVNLTLANLAPAYIAPILDSATFGLLGERVWAFSRVALQIHLIKCTLVLPEEELSYTKYWITFLVSPVPEAQAKAAWLSVISVKVHEVNSSGVYYQAVQSFTATYTDVRLTSSLGPDYPLMPQETGLAMLQAEGVPLTAVRQIKSAAGVDAALAVTKPDGQGSRWLLLVANITLAGAGPLLASSAANGTAVALPGSTVFTRGPQAASVRLGLGHRADILSVPDRATATLQRLILGELAPRRQDYDPKQPLEVLSFPLWNLQLGQAYSKVLLHNCTVLVSNQELALLQHSLLQPAAARAPGTASAAPAFDVALVSAVRAFFNTQDILHVASYSSSYITVETGTTPRYGIQGVTFRAPVVADGEPEAAGFPAPPAGSGGGGGLEGWEVGVIVGCVVGGVLLLLLGSALFVAVRRRQRRQGQPGSEEGGQRAYEKYLTGSVEVADRQTGGRSGGGGGGGSDLVNPSQELTNSSQVLRPGARNSDMEVAAAAAGRLKSGSGTVSAASASASASGGIGIGGPSASGTRVHSQGNSSATDIGAGGGVVGAAAAAGGSGGVSASSGMPTSNMRSSLTVGTAGPSTHSHGAETDSFDRPPSASCLGQHGPIVGGDPRRASVVGSSAATTAATVASNTAYQSVLASGGGAALEQMHQIIHVMGKGFNDRQLEIQGLLGRGAHGTVYRGRWRGLPVAIKSMIFSSEHTVRQQHRPLMEAAISSNLAHPNIVTTYSYELREVEHELASLSPELARQGGGWRLLIIQEYCDGGPLRRIIDCGFFLTPPRPSPHRAKLKLPNVGLLRKESPSAGTVSEGSVGATTARSEVPYASAAMAAAAAGSSSRGSSGSSGSSVHGQGNSSGGRCSPAGGRNEPAGTVAAAAATATATRAGRSAQGGQSGLASKAQLEDVPPDVPPRPSSSLQAATRYVEAALMITRGLQHIHDKNIVHGDLNPNNVLLMRAPDTPLGFCLKVADFGLSVRMAEGESHMSNLFQGSPYYCAPEVVLTGKIGKPADIYSLGVMLWELQNGMRPQWRLGVRLRTYPSLNTAELEFGPETPPRFARLARDCFHGSRDARPNIAYVMDALVGIKAELDAFLRP